jgi:hypothetical protein
MTIQSSRNGLHINCSCKTHFISLRRVRIKQYFGFFHDRQIVILLLINKLLFGVQAVEGGTSQNEIEPDRARWNQYRTNIEPEMQPTCLPEWGFRSPDRVQGRK